MEKKEEIKKKVVLDYLKKYHKKYKVEDLKKKIIASGYPAEYVEEALITLGLKRPAEKKAEEETKEIEKEKALKEEKRKKAEEELKKKAEEEIGVAKKKHPREKVIIIILIVLILLAFLILIIFAFYFYFEKIEKYLGLGASIEEARLNADGKTAYIKLEGGINEGNITKIKFIFTDKEGNENYYETSEGTQEISVPFKRSFWDWLLRREKYEGIYDYEINAQDVGLNDFFGIEEVSVAFEYETEQQQEVETPSLDTEKPTNQTTTKLPTGGGGGGGGGGSGTTPPPSCTPNTCAILEKECGNWDDGCSSIINCGSCKEEYSCSEGECISLFPQDYVSYWKFESEIAGITPDEKGINNGTVYGAIFNISGGIIGGAYEFDGANGYINSGNDASLDIVEEITISAWVKNIGNNTNGWASGRWDDIITKWNCINSSCNKSSWWLGINPTGKVEFIVINFEGVNSHNVRSTSIIKNDSIWHHVVAVYDNSSLKIYVDGSFENETLYNQSIHISDVPVRIAASSHTIPNGFNGSIDEVMIYNRALNETEIQQIYDSQKLPPPKCGDAICEAGENCPQDASNCTDRICIEPTCINGCGEALVPVRENDEVCVSPLFCNGAGSCIECINDNDCLTDEICQAEQCIAKFPLDYVAYWKFESEIAGTTPDETGINNGTLIGNAQFVSGIKGQAIKVDINNYVNVPDSNSLDITNEITLLVWVRRESYVNHGKIITKRTDDYNTNPWELYALDFKGSGDSNSYPCFLISNGSEGGQVSTCNNSHFTVLNKWDHIAGIYNGSLMSLYVNGLLVSNIETSILIGTNNMPLTIGARNYSDFYTNGTIDEIMIYNRSLNETEIQQIYCSQGGEAEFCSGLGGSSASLSPLSRILNFFKSLLIAKTGKTITWNVAYEKETLEKNYFAVVLMIILVLLLILISVYFKKFKKSKYKSN